VLGAVSSPSRIQLEAGTQSVHNGKRLEHNYRIGLCGGARCVGVVLQPEGRESDGVAEYTDTEYCELLHYVGNHIPLSMAPAHPTENELFPKLGRLVGGMN